MVLVVSEMQKLQLDLNYRRRQNVRQSTATRIYEKWFVLSEQACTRGFTWPSLLEHNEWCQYMSTGIKKSKRGI